MDLKNFKSEGFGDTRIEPCVWNARWVWHPDGEMSGIEMMCFRKEFKVDKPGCVLFLNVSADSRYRVWVNGKFIGRGPCKGDLLSYFYEGYDVSSLLRIGKNVIAVEVLSFHNYGPVSEIHHRGALIVEGALVGEDGKKIIDISTADGTWLVDKDTSFSPCPIEKEKLFGWAGLGFMEEVDGRLILEGWREICFDDNKWLRVKEMSWCSTGVRRGNPGINSFYWGLTPRVIPPLEEIPENFKRIICFDDRLRKKTPIFIRRGKRFSCILDAGELTTGYVRLELSGGKGTSIKLTYAESLSKNGEKIRYREYKNGDEVKGYYDKYIASGRDDIWETFFWKTFRYIFLEVEAQDEPLKILNVSYLFTSYPFKLAANFSSSDVETKKMWEIGWRTFKLCAHETFEDCPYYEQIQYVADSRVAALLSYYLSCEPALGRQAILAFYSSMLPEGIIRCSYPTNAVCVIPTFSLFWIMMIKDYFMFTGDKNTVKYLLRGKGIEAVLEWFADRITPEGLIGKLPWFNFVDWSPKWRNGVPPEAEIGSSAAVTLQYVVAIQEALSLGRYFKDSFPIDKWERLEQSLVKAVEKHCWAKKIGLFADGPSSSNFSQHANIWALLSEKISRSKKEAILKRLTCDKKLAQTSFFYTFYLSRALAQVGRYELLWPKLEPWRTMIRMKLSTWAEDNVNNRSDCHVWSAWLNYDFLTEILGIKPNEPGFRSILINPRDVPLNWAKGSMITPGGSVSVKWQKRPGTLYFDIETPRGVKTIIEFKNFHEETKGGRIVRELKYPPQN